MHKAYSRRLRSGIKVYPQSSTFVRHRQHDSLAIRAMSSNLPSNIAECLLAGADGRAIRDPTGFARLQ
jgi:hypothetical protein